MFGGDSVGKVVRKPACMAFASVERVGEKSDLWMNVTPSAAAGASMTEFIAWAVVVWVDWDTALREW